MLIRFSAVAGLALMATAAMANGTATSAEAVEAAAVERTAEAPAAATERCTPTPAHFVGAGKTPGAPEALNNRLRCVGVETAAN